MEHAFQFNRNEITGKSLHVLFLHVCFTFRSIVPLHDLARSPDHVTGAPDFMTLFFGQTAPNSHATFVNDVGIPYMILISAFQNPMGDLFL